jgi:hypothetical protein
MPKTYNAPSIDEYLCNRQMPVEERVHLDYSPPCGSGNSGPIIPAVTGSSLGCEVPASAPGLRFGCVGMPVRL